MILCSKYKNEVVRKEMSDIVFDDDFDVIIIGLGTAGAIAAICSARYGMKVLAIEKNNGMGGTATKGGVLGYYYGAVGGIFEEIDSLSYKANKKDFTPTNPVYPDYIHPDIKSVILENKAIEAGAKICYDSYVFGVYLQSDRVIGIQWRDQCGVHNTKAKYIVDCTGEAEICSLAGCKTRQGRALDSKCQPYSLCTLTVKDGTIHSYYIDNGYINANDAKSFSNQMMNTFTQKMFLKEHYNPQEYFSVIASQVGIREGRTIIGEENITFEAFLEDKMSDKPLFYAYSNIDTHSREHAFESKNYIEWSTVSRLRKLNFSVPVPKGSLIPQGYKGILAVGRCIAVDHDISPCVRMKRDMQKCGEAVAALAYLSIQYAVAAVDVPYAELAAMLQKTKCLDESNNIMTYRSGEPVPGQKVNIPVKWLTDKNEICEQLKCNEPGIGIWSAKRLGVSIIDSLKEWMQAESKNLRTHSAYALAMLGDVGSLEVLRKIVEKSNRGYDNKTALERYHDLSAIYLVGELGDLQSIKYLMTIIDEINRIVGKINTGDVHSEGNDVYYQYFNYALMAIINIYHKCNDHEIKMKILEFSRSMMDHMADIKVMLNDREDLYYSFVQQVSTIIEKNIVH